MWLSVFRVLYACDSLNDWVFLGAGSVDSDQYQQKNVKGGYHVCLLNPEKGLNVQDCSNKSTAMGFVEEFVDVAFDSNRNESGKGQISISIPKQNYPGLVASYNDRPGNEVVSPHSSSSLHQQLAASRAGIYRDLKQESHAIARKPRDAACFSTPNDSLIGIGFNL